MSNRLVTAAARVQHEPKATPPYHRASFEYDSVADPAPRIAHDARLHHRIISDDDPITDRDPLGEATTVAEPHIASKHDERTDRDVRSQRRASAKPSRGIDPGGSR